MAPAVTLASRARHVRRSLATTPGLLRLFLAGIWALTVLFSWSTWIAVERHRREIQTIGRDSAPSIIAAQSIKWNLADMHGNVIRQFLGTPDQARDAANLYRQRRANVTDGLLAAAQNITYGDAERVPIRNLMNGLAGYDEAVAQASALASRPRGEEMAMARLRNADAIMAATLVPSAEALDKANQDALDHGYSQEQSLSGHSTALFVICSLVLITVLVGAQGLLQRRMHRRLSPALIAATLLTIVWTCSSFAALRAETHDLKVVKEDAFDSIGAMWRARADAYDAQSHLALSLLDSASAPAAKEAFERDSSSLAKLSGGLTFEALQPLVDRGEVPELFQGYIAAELRNITFEGEREAAVEMLQQYAHYIAVVRGLRETDRRGEHPKAVALCLGDSSDQARGALTAFDAALAKVLDINQKEFDRAVVRGFEDVDGLGFWIIAVGLITALLAHFGLLQRLKEYRL